LPEQLPQVNLKTVVKLRRAGFSYPIRVIQEAKRAGLPLSYAMAFLEKESYKGKNVFGSDAVRNPVKGGRVTRRRYAQYLKNRKAGLGMQGVGPMQLTYYTLQDKADKMGGAWRVRYNLRVGFEHAAGLIESYGKFDGVKRYNGSGQMAQAYARDWVQKQQHWHAYLKS
jgi:hypothetical protein